MSSFAGHYGNPGPKHTPNATAETNPSTIASRMTARASNLSSKFNPAIAFAVLSWPTLSRGLRDELTGELRETRKWLYTSLGHDESKTIPPQFVNPATAYSLDAPSRLSPNEDWSGRAHSNLTDVTVELRPYFDAMTTHNNKIGRTYLTHLQSFSDMDPTEKEAAQALLSTDRLTTGDKETLQKALLDLEVKVDLAL
jgi:hypothetical protein